MKHRKIWIIIAGVVLIVAGVLGVVFVRQNWNSKDTGPHSIEFTFGFDEFTFMKHTLSEGDRMSAIMMENNIGMANSVNDTRDYFVYYADNMKAQVLMCPYEIDGDRNYRASVYIVSKESENDRRIHMSIDKSQPEYDTYYKGPIQIGDSLEQVYEYLHIDEIKKYGELEEKNNRKYYTCDSNLGVITFHEEPFTGLQELEKYKTPEEYLKTGNTIQYIINFATYDLQVQVDESLTVSHISLAYDPDRTGTVNQTYLSPREIFIHALRYEAVHIVLVHNHPSGRVTPSEADIQSTLRIRDAGQLLGIQVSDHIIVAGDHYLSMLERGIL